MNADPTSLDMEVELRATEGERTIAFVRPSGEIDLANSERLKSALSGSDTAGSDGMVLDLTRVSFMDSSGLRVALTAARDGGDRFVTIVKEGSAVASLVELVDVADRLNVVTAEVEALARLGAAQPG